MGGGALLALLSALSVGLAAAACPAACSCRWKGGKKTVGCVGRQLTALPDPVDVDTQVLDVRGSALTRLPERVFQRRGLLDLQRIYLARCRLTELGERPLAALTNLMELDLSENALSAVPAAALADVPALRQLSLSGNPLRRLGRGDLSTLRELTWLELARCQLEVVEPGAFAALQRLEKLHLQRNRLTTLAAADLSLQLHEVQLHDNRWACDCRLRPLRRWLRRYTVPLAVAPRCAAPRRLAGRAVRNTSELELACAPAIAPSARLFEVPLDSSVTLTCAADAEPPPRLSWTLAGAPLPRDGRYLVSGSLRRSRLIILNASEEDSGEFRCRAENAAGVSWAGYVVRVLLPPDSRSSGAAPAPPGGLALPVTGALLLLATVLIVMAVVILAVLRGRRRRRARKAPALGTSLVAKGEEREEEDEPKRPASVSQSVSRETTFTDFHDYQVQQLHTQGAQSHPVHTPSNQSQQKPPQDHQPRQEPPQERGHEHQLCEHALRKHPCREPRFGASDSDSDVVRDVRAVPVRCAHQAQRGACAGHERGWQRCAWTLERGARASHGDIPSGLLARRGSWAERSRSYHYQLSEAAPALPELGWRSLPRPARPRPPSQAHWRRTVLAPPQPVAGGATPVCSCLLVPSLGQLHQLRQLPACGHPAPPPRRHHGRCCRCREAAPLPEPPPEVRPELRPEVTASGAPPLLGPPAEFDDNVGRGEMRCRSRCARCGCARTSGQPAKAPLFRSPLNRSCELQTTDNCNKDNNDVDVDLSGQLRW